MSTETSKQPTVSSNVDHTTTTTSLLDGDIPTTPSANADEQVIVALGYKQEFKREFSLWTTFCLSFAVLGLLPSFGSTLSYGMGYAGTAGMVWGWIIAMVFIQCIAMAMAELCSAMPTSGGLYYAAAVLAPTGYGPFAAWITGWSNWIGQITAAPSVDYSLAAMILAAASIEYPGYVPTAWQTFLLTLLILNVHAGISSMPTRWIARVNSYGSTFNMLALVTVLIAIPAGVTNNGQNGHRFTPSSEVWGTITNGTDFPSGIAVLMTFVGVIWTMAGYDSPFHLSEECSNANIAAPRAIVMTSAVGGVLGGLLQFVVAYTVRDIDAVMNSPLGQPWASYLLQVLPRQTAMALLGLTIICGFSMGQGCMVAASRVTYAYARDDCFPLSRVWKKVNTRTQTPVNAVLLNATLGITMSLLVLAGRVAIGALFSIGAIAQFVAFAIPITIRVVCHKRFRGQRGPWHLGGFGRGFGAIGVSFVVLMVPVLCLPKVTGERLTARLMNWTCLVYGAPMLGVVGWWVVDARRWFKGPKVNVEHVAQVAGVIEGENDVDEEGDGDGDGDDDDYDERGSQESTRSLMGRFK